MNTGKDEHEYDAADDLDVIPEEESGDSPIDQIKTLKEKLRTCQKERQEFLDGWQRSKADFLNQKKRFEDGGKRDIERAEAAIMVRLLSLADSFDMAFKNTEAWKSIDPSWAKGVEGIHAQLQSIFKEHDVEEIAAVGTPFNPELHEATAHAPVGSEAEHHTVVDVIQKGYTMHGTLLRPARVIIGNYEGQSN